MFELNIDNVLKYGTMLCDNILEDFPEGMINPLPYRFDYHKGVLLSGMEKMSKLVNKEKYEDFIKSWIDLVVTEDGVVQNNGKGWCSFESLDFRQPGILLFNIYRRTGDEKYAKAIRYLTESLNEYPVTEKGTLWHAVYFPREVWLDGLYMASPIMTMYAMEFDKPEYLDMAANQILTMYETMKDDRGLLHHGYDYTKQAIWADPITGLSPEVWGRAIGWFVMGIAEILEYLPKEHKDYQRIVEIEQEILFVLCKYQHASGRWFQVIDKVDDSRNWLENSASNLITAALAKCIRVRILSAQYLENIEKSFNGIMNTVRIEGDRIIVPEICAGTNIETGTLEHYYNRPVIENDKHGTGTFLIMLAEVGLLLNNDMSKR